MRLLVEPVAAAAAVVVELAAVLVVVPVAVGEYEQEAAEDELGSYRLAAAVESVDSSFVAYWLLFHPEPWGHQELEWGQVGRGDLVLWDCQVLTEGQDAFAACFAKLLWFDFVHWLLVVASAAAVAAALGLDRAQLALPVPSP